MTADNFVSMCTSAGTARGECERLYREMSGPDGLPFETFKAIDQELSSDPTQTPAELEAFLLEHSPSTLATP